MKNSIQIVLFFEKDTAYNVSKIASLINEKFSDIGNPILLPFNGMQENANIPYIIFNQNQNINLMANFQSISIMLFNEMMDRKDEFIKLVFSIFNDVVFVRMGFIVNKVLDRSAISDISSETSCNDIVLLSKDFKIAWLNEIQIDNLNVNMWKSYLTDNNNTDSILCVYDFNTCIEDNLQLSEKKVTEFINLCDNKV